MQTNPQVQSKKRLSYSNKTQDRLEELLPWLSFGIVALIGLIHLPFPFNGDQAFFTLAAKEMASGEVLYRDFWDLKQPGVFVFYYLASQLFGAHEVGIHSLEWLVLVGFSGLLLWLLRPHFQRTISLALVPLLTVGLYYSVSPSLFLTQVEALVGVPLFGLIWCFQKALLSTRLRYRWVWLLLGGFLGATVLFLKLLFLIVLVPISLFSLFRITQQQVTQQQLAEQSATPSKRTLFLEVRRTGLAMSVLAVPLLLGAFLPWLAMFVYFYTQDSLFIMYETFFVYPQMIVTGNAEKDWLQFVKSLGFFGVAFFPSVALGSMQVYQTLRRDSDLLMNNLAIWSVVGLCTIWLQSQAWWPYYYLLLFVPLGILAAHFLDQRWNSLGDLWKRSRRHYFRRFILVLLCSSLWLSPLVGVGIKSFLFVQTGLALSPAARLEYQTKIRDQYSVVINEIESIGLAVKPSQVGSESIFVMGDPLIYFLSNRLQAGAISGWALEYLLDTQWQKLEQQLDAQRPIYIFIADYYQRFIAQRAPKIPALLEQDYMKLRQSDVGTWYTNDPLLKEQEFNVQRQLRFWESRGGRAQKRM